MRLLLQKTLQSGVLATAIVFGMGSVSAQAATPTDASITKLMQVMHMSEMMEHMLGSKSDMIQSMVQAQIQKSDTTPITPAQRQQINNIVDKNISQMLAKIEPQVNQLAQKGFIDAAKQYYTQQEVDAQIEFYSSAVGQSIVEKQPEVMQAYMVNIMPEIMGIMDKQMQVTMPVMIKELDAVIPQK
ncbi:DUF2059 domain-containing protein [Psychrobacter sp. I-STPA10]|uniref:DUF2059 domain-containing protein n=1 Tax=Psychrobacter sp. I-STPA10 TaxID=2585769 RepID=UPI001E38C32B|nr:DUF2059 domain-containing protein [Psychrobacter sp. I-STPA10]